MTGLKQFFAGVLAVIVGGTLPACAVYRKCGFAGCPGDARVTADVRTLFRDYSALQPPNLLYVKTLDRVVYLSGQVNTDMERSMAESVALEAAGVKRVVNSINVSYEGR